MKRVVLENELGGGTTADTYAIADRVRCGIFHTGQKAILLLADGETAVIGTSLAPGAGGYVVAVASGSAEAIAEAAEAMDMSGSSGADPGTDHIAVIFY